MDLSLSHLFSMARFTVQKPREGARMVMQADVPTGARWVALALTAVLSALLAHISFSLLPADELATVPESALSPIVTAVIQAVIMVLSVVLIHWVGKLFKGTGSFDDGLILLVWLQFIVLFLQVLQILVQIAFPSVFSNVIGILSLVLFLWLLINFIAELHGFRSVLLTAVGFMGALFIFAFILALLVFPMLGVQVQ